MKKIGKIVFLVLLVALGFITMTSCGDGDGLAKEVLSKVIFTQEGKHVTEDFAILKTVKHNDETYNVTWTSGDESLISLADNTDPSKVTADVKRPFDANAEVKLTATVEAKGKKASGDFITIVDKIDFEKAAVSKLGIADGYNREDISEPVVVTLPTSTKDFKDEITYTYAIEGTPATVKLEGNTLTVDPTSGKKEVVVLKVKASSSVSKNIVVKVNVNQVTYNTIEEYDAAAEGDILTVKGIIVAREPYAAGFKNTTLYLQDISGKGGYNVFRISCETEEAYNTDLAIGNVLLVTGKKTTFNDLRQFSAKSTYEVAPIDKTPNNTDITEFIKTDVSNLSLDLQCQLIHFFDLTVQSVEKEDEKGRWNILVGDAKDTNKQFTVRIDTGLLTTTSDAYKAIKDLNITVGDVISASGVCGWYKKAQLLPLAADSVKIESKGTTPDPTPDESNVEVDYVVPEEGFDKTKTMEIRFSHTMGDRLQQVLQTAIDSFEKDYPNVKVKASQVGGFDYLSKLITADIPNGLEPHIAYCYPDHVALYNKSNAVIRLDNLIKAGAYGFTSEELADFIPGFYNEGKQFGDNHMYSLPFSKATEVLYYNKTVFEAEGWTVPTTWQEVMQLCKTIKECKDSKGNLKYPNCIPLGIDSEANLFITLCEQTGSKYTTASGSNHFLFDNPENRSYVEQFRTWYKDGLFTTQTILNTYTSSLFTAYPAKTEADKYSFMSIGSTGGASYQYPDSKAFEVGVVAIPTWNDSPLKVISQGPSLCLFKKQDPQEVLAAWIFVTDYLLETDFQAAFSYESGYNPVLKSTYETGMLYGKGANGVDILYKDWLNSGDGRSPDGLTALTLKKAQEFVNNYYTSPAFDGSSKARDQVGSLFVAVITGEKTTDKAFSDALAVCEDKKKSLQKHKQQDSLM